MAVVLFCLVCMIIVQCIHVGEHLYWPSFCATVSLLWQIKSDFHSRATYSCVQQQLQTHSMGELNNFAHYCHMSPWIKCVQ